MILWYYMRQVFAVKQNEMHITTVTIVIILFETLLNRMVFFCKNHKKFVKPEEITVHMRNNKHEKKTIII